MPAGRPSARFVDVSKGTPILSSEHYAGKPAKAQSNGLTGNATTIELDGESWVN